jgi:hypothetical protein
VYGRPVVSGFRPSQNNRAVIRELEQHAASRGNCDELFVLALEQRARVVQQPGAVHGAQPSDRYRCPVPSSKYNGMTGIRSRSMYSQTFSSVQCRSGWIRTCVPGAKSVWN